MPVRYFSVQSAILKSILRSILTKLQSHHVRIHLTTGESGSKQVQTFPWDSLWKLYTVYKS